MHLLLTPQSGQEAELVLCRHVNTQRLPPNFLLAFTLGAIVDPSYVRLHT
jgi:hypothetical protein